MEMARMRDEDRIWLDEYDRQYLNHFPEQFWGRALLYRYSQEAFKNAHLDIHNVKLYDNDLHAFKIFKVPAYMDELIAKLNEKGYDPSNVNVSLSSAKKAARDLLAGKPASFSMFNAKVGYDGAAANPLPNKSQHPETTYGALPLSPQDKEFLQWFKTNNLGQYAMQAFMKRYSGEYVNNTRKFVNMTLNGRQGPVVAQGVPMNGTQLQQELQILKNHGIDFVKNPLQKVAAMRWLKTGFYNPGKQVGYRWADPASTAPRREDQPLNLNIKPTNIRLT